MNLLQDSVDAVKSIFGRSSWTSSNPPTRGLATTFPKFSELPAELRIKIWEFAIEPQLKYVHRHTIHPEWLHDENRWRGYAAAGATDSELPAYVPDSVSRPGAFVSFSRSDRPTHMILTACSTKHPCGCHHYPPHAPERPLTTSPIRATCRESRDLRIWNTFKRILESEYDTYGQTAVSPISPISGLRRGVAFNPALDILAANVNVASTSSVRELHHLATIIAQQESTKDIAQVVVRLQIAMPPYKFWKSARFSYWKKWGESKWWVPVRSLLKLKSLEEVVLLKPVNEKMLPKMWEERTMRIWAEALQEQRSLWPEEWKGNAPALIFVENVKVLARR